MPKKFIQIRFKQMKQCRSYFLILLTTGFFSFNVKIMADQIPEKAYRS